MSVTQSDSEFSSTAGTGKPTSKYCSTPYAIVETLACMPHCGTASGSGGAVLPPAYIPAVLRSTSVWLGTAAVGAAAAVVLFFEDAVCRRDHPLSPHWPGAALTSPSP